MKRVIISLLCGLGMGGVVWFAESIGLEVGTTIASRLTPPIPPMEGFILVTVHSLPYFMGVLTSVLVYTILLRQKRETTSS